MKIGEMRHRITFQEAQKTSDGYKGFTETWVYVVEVWASVEPLSGRERFFSMQIKAEVTHKVKIRYRAGLSEDMRITFGGRILLIEGMRDIDERREVLEFVCREEK